jgi:hypothetical protein
MSVRQSTLSKKITADDDAWLRCDPEQEVAAAGEVLVSRLPPPAGKKKESQYCMTAADMLSSGGSASGANFLANR